jgi:hypothetical protein
LGALADEAQTSEAAGMDAGEFPTGEGASPDGHIVDAGMEDSDGTVVGVCPASVLADVEGEVRRRGDRSEFG